MKKLLISSIVIAMLSGCVITPYRYSVQPAVVVQSDVVVYPQVESAYIWDPLALSFFFIFGGQRHYMARGWGYHTHGVPYGHYRR